MSSTSPLRWVKASHTTIVPPGAVAGGVTTNGETTYVARVSSPQFHGKVPCALIPSSGVASVPYGCVEHQLNDYEVLVCDDPAVLFWVEGDNGSVPPLAVGVGNSYNPSYFYLSTEELYIAKTHPGPKIDGRTANGKKELKLPKKFSGSLLGKVHPSHHCLYVPNDGHEYIVHKYLVLCAHMPPLKIHSSLSTWQWVEVSDGKVPAGALIGGTTVSGEATYVARAKHRRETVSGHVVPSKKLCMICWGCTEHMKSTYEVLVVDDPSGFTWELARNGELPCNAIASQESIRQGILEGVGRTITNCDLTVGITWDDKKIPIPVPFSRTFQIVGKVAVGHRCLYVPYEGLEYIYREYEALRALSSPNTLKELCRYVILASTNAVPDRISSLPLPERLKVFCQLRKDEWNNS